VWFMMIAGFAVTAGVAGHYLDPFSPSRLLTVTATVSALAMIVTMLAIRNVEPSSYISQPTANTEKPAFSVALKKIWQERQARQFTMFVFFSMFAYSFQDLILEPYAGLVFGLSPGASTQLAGTQHAGVLLGMIAVAASGSLFSRHGVRLLRAWTVGGCIASGLVLLALASGGLSPETWHLSGNVFLLGFANGAFAVAAIATMMTLASAGQSGREGLRMGLWGAAQAIAFALGGFLGTVAVDVCQIWIDVPAHAYGLVFSFEAFMFLVAAWLGLGIGKAEQQEDLETSAPSFGEIAMQEVMAGRN
jgi:BCD family chlorophyll transporter-like MFS transporter